jgi:peptidoglycan DL-endopeptidase CwlO
MDGKAVAVLGGAVVLMWSGIHGIGLTDSVQNLIQGKPFPKTQTDAITVPAGLAGSSDGAMFSGSSSAIAADAMQYQGLGYKWAGWAGKPGVWDCSSFVSYVLNHDLGIPIPGYRKPHSFGGKGHGPTVATYRLWTGARTVSQADAQPGDLVCFGTRHIGIYLGNGKMISAENPRRGTRVDPVFKGPTYRRII